MKIKTKSFLARVLSTIVAPALCVAVGFASEPLKETTAVHTRPDRASPAITVLKAGTQPSPASGDVSAPAGWMAIELPGPFEAYVANTDLSKNLDVKPGSSIRLAPKPDAPVIATAEKGDKITITGLRGRWTQISLNKKLVGYVSVNATAPQASATASVPPAPAPSGASSSAAAQPAPMAPAPVAPGAYGVASPGQAAPSVNVGDANALPRQFAGRLVSTRRAFTPRRPYEYALNDDAGKRYAYLDLSKLLLTEQIEKFIDHSVVVFGAAKPVPNTRDIVILVETLRLK